MRKKQNTNWVEVVKNRKIRKDAIFLEMGGMRKTITEWCDFLKLTHGKNAKQKIRIKNCCRLKMQQEIVFGYKTNCFLYHADKNLPPIPEDAIS